MKTRNDLVSLHSVELYCCRILEILSLIHRHTRITVHKIQIIAKIIAHCENAKSSLISEIVEDAFEYLST